MSNRDFHLVQKGPTRGDETAPYNVVFTRQLTVEEFVNRILDLKEWGKIEIQGMDICCWYKNDTIESPFPETILKRKIMSANASGGWSRMDYMLRLEEE